MKRETLEHGSSLAWTAIFLITVLMPLMLLITDGSRLWYIRGRLQTATDAACETAAWVGGDRPNYMASGQTRLGDEGDMLALAQDTFFSTLSESTRMAFSAQLAVSLDSANNQVLCSATARVPVLFYTGGVMPAVDVPASSIAAIRFR